MSLEFRRDNRTEEKFAEDISHYTSGENKWAEIFSTELKERGYQVEYRDNGVDNTGKLITGRVNSNPDFVFIINGIEYKIEIKTSPFKELPVPFLTYKVDALTTCIDQNAHVVTANPNWFCKFKPDFAKDILDKYDPDIYYKFSPNDLAIRVYKENIEEYKKEGKIKFHQWRTNAQELIKLNYNKLKERAK